MWIIKLLLALPVNIAALANIAMRQAVGEVTNKTESEVDQLLDKEFAKYGKKSDKE